MPVLFGRWTWIWTKENLNSLTLVELASALAVEGSLSSAGSIQSQACSAPLRKSTRKTRKCWAFGVIVEFCSSPSWSLMPMRFVVLSLVPWPMNSPSPREKLWMRFPLSPSMMTLAQTVSVLLPVSVFSVRTLFRTEVPVLPIRFPETVSSLPDPSVSVKPGETTLMPESPDHGSFQSPVPPLRPLRAPVV